MKKENVISYLLIALPVICLFCFVVSYVQNIPYNDDYHTIITFLSAREGIESFGDFARVYFGPYAEHRVVFVRLFTALLALFGKVNFAVLAVIGNISFLIGYIFLLKSVKIDRSDRLFYLVPTAYLLFHLQSWGILLWAMGALSHLLILCWVILSLYFFFKSRTGSWSHFIAAIIFGTFASYTNGNGVFVFFVAAFTFLFLKEYRKSLLAFAVFILFFVLNVLSSSGAISSNMSHQNGIDAVKKIFLFLGSAFFHPSYLFIALAAGVFFVIYFAYLFFVKQYYKINPVTFSLFLFICITSVAVATQREMVDIYTIAASRFRLYGSLMVVITYISMLETFPRVNMKNFVRFAVLPVSVAFFAVGTYAGKNKMEDRFQLNRSYSFLLDNNIYLDNYFDSMYHMAINREYISSQNIPVSSLVIPVSDGNYAIGMPDNDIAYSIDTVLEKQGHVIVKGWAGKTDKKNTLNSIYVVLYTKGHAKVFGTNHLEVPAFLNDKKMFHYATCGFLAVIPAEEYKNADSVIVAISRGVGTKDMVPAFSVKDTHNSKNDISIR